MEKVEILEEALNKLLNKNNEYVKTGFTDLDTLLSGTEKGSLIVIGGRPSMGKTGLMMSIFENLIKQKFKCLFFNLETSNNSFMQRFLCQYSQLPSQRIKCCELTEKDTEKLSEVYKEIKEFDFYVDDNSHKIEEIEEKIKEYKPQYVFIDYLQLIHTNPKKQRCEELSKIILQLKTIAKENNVFIFLSCSLWRVNYSRYVDDLIFSSDNKCILKMVEKRIEMILNEYGYRVNNKKTKYLCENKQQNILGLIVNQGRVRLPKEFKRSVRAMLYHYALFKSGNSFNIKYSFNEKQLSGYIPYIKHVDKSGYRQLKAYANKLTYKYGVSMPFFDKNLTTFNLLNNI